MKCVTNKQGKELVVEIHGGLCGASLCLIILYTRDEADDRCRVQHKIWRMGWRQVGVWMKKDKKVATGGIET